MGSKTPRISAKPAKKAAAKAKPRLLSGGNPQIAKGFGEEPIKAQIAAMPGWKSDLGRRLDALSPRAFPAVPKAVKWNSPLNGADEKTYFLGVHVFDRYIKIAFLMGAHLKPEPTVSSKQKNGRYLHVREDDDLDEAQLTEWVKQASKLPGEEM
ncbi:MAG: DUF1801 domain-containing protein [Hyphomonadaceae bacterium]